MKKIRLLDKLLQISPVLSKKDAYALIVCGEVSVNNEKIRDPGFQVPADSDVTVKQKEDFVSRGGNKLEYAIRQWNLPVADKVFLDAGASTGGFTHALLKHGARFVHAVDVGYNQLDYSLRNDSRVGVMERTNIMGLEHLDPPADAAVADLSFRSISRPAKKILDLTLEKWMVGLVKPQFELKEETEDFDGIVRSDTMLIEILDTVIDSLSSEGIFVQKVLLSPITGRKGNREFLFYLTLEKGPKKSEILGVCKGLIE